jgi:hypothetical protein
MAKTKLLDDLLAGSIQSRPINNQTFSQAAINTTRQWLSMCQGSHQECRSKKLKFVPTRLLQIIDSEGPPESDCVRLVDGANVSKTKSPQYAALSYCWGGEQSFKLIKSNRVHYRTSLPTVSLPKTLTDAIRVARSLDISYIWIDSLCIIQDDTIDKLHEISRMADYFRNATVTIAAASAPCANAGFLEVKTDRLYEYSPFSFPCRLKDQKGTLIFSRERDFGTSEPLDSRAWALQETLLSRRLLVYGSQQVQWRCRELALRDGGSRRDYKSKAKSVIYDPEWYRQFASSEAGDCLSVWRSLLQEYTIRNLSESQDKLLALSGLASSFGRGNGRYVAGLWQDRLQPQLLWKVAGSAETRPANYRAPSWSWASVDGGISCELCQLPPGIPKGQKTWNLVESKINLGMKNAQYGSVTSASITIRTKRTIMPCESRNPLEAPALAGWRRKAGIPVETSTISTGRESNWETQAKVKLTGKVQIYFSGIEAPVFFRLKTPANKKVRMPYIDVTIDSQEDKEMLSDVLDKKQPAFFIEIVPFSAVPYKKGVPADTPKGLIVVPSSRKQFRRIGVFSFKGVGETETLDQRNARASLFTHSSLVNVTLV